MAQPDPSARLPAPAPSNGMHLAPRHAVPRSIPEQIAERIGAAIIAGQRHQGERLIETDLAQAFGVSRGPIREALRILERRRLIDLVPRRGAYVKAISLNSIVDLFNARMALSGLAVRLMSVIRPASYLETLGRRIAELRRLCADPDVDPVEFAYVVTRAIRTIARGSANELVVDLMTNLAEQTVWTTIWKTPLDYLSVDSREAAVVALEGVLAAIERGDAGDAERRLRDFLERDRDAAIGELARLRGESVDAFRLVRTSGG